VDKPTERQGRSALFLAAELGRVHAVTLLVEHNADVNVLADNGQSSLIVAAAERHSEVVAMLKTHGANQDHEWMGLTADAVVRHISDINADGGTDGSMTRCQSGEMRQSYEARPEDDSVGKAEAGDRVGEEVTALDDFCFGESVGSSSSASSVALSSVSSLVSGSDGGASATEEHL
jgi:hypothetical protein